MIHRTDADSQYSTCSTDATASRQALRLGSRPAQVLLVAILILIPIAAFVWTHWAESDRALGGSQRIRPRRGTLNGFDLSNSVLPAKLIRRGGPPRDGIPALVDPPLIDASRASYMRPFDRIAGIVIDGTARAYPLKILNYHEVVNDRVGRTSLAVTYCPLCDSVVVFDRRTDRGELQFGVSGLLYNSNVLLYDRSGQGTESLWSQVMRQSVAGDRVGETLKTLPVELTTWSAWSARHPRTKVVSISTGHQRDYGRNPYSAYFSGNGLMFPVNKKDSRLRPKTRVLGVWTQSGARAYPLAQFRRFHRDADLEDELDGKSLRLSYNDEANSLRVAHADEGLSWMYAFWFAWSAFHPETEVFRSSEHP
jgi:hypothetical protein